MRYWTINFDTPLLRYSASTFTCRYAEYESFSNFRRSRSIQRSPTRWPFNSAFNSLNFAARSFNSAFSFLLIKPRKILYWIERRSDWTAFNSAFSSDNCRSFNSAFSQRWTPFRTAFTHTLYIHMSILLSKALCSSPHCSQGHFVPRARFYL